MEISIIFSPFSFRLTRTFNSNKSQMVQVILRLLYPLEGKHLIYSHFIIPAISALYLLFYLHQNSHLLFSMQ